MKITTIVCIAILLCFSAAAQQTESCNCSTTIVRATEERMHALGENDVYRFLRTFDSTCSANAEYSEYSNDILFKILERYPKFCISVLSRHTDLDAGYIYNEIKSPLSDNYNLNRIISSVNAVRSSGSAKRKIISALKEAARPAGVRIPEAMSDTVFIDSTALAFDKAFYYALVYKHEGKRHEIYRIKNRDYSIEFERNYAYYNDGKNYSCYTVYDLPTGARWDILFNQLSQTFYRTDVYDLHALGDELVKESVDFKHQIGTIRSKRINGIKTYRVRLKKIWPATHSKG